MLSNHTSRRISRRAALVGLAAGGAALAGRATSLRGGEEESRTLHFEIRDEFAAPVANINALLQTTAGEIWRHCPHTHFLAQGFSIYRHPRFPITHFEHQQQRIVIGLNTGDTYWSQYAYQFAHEFCHALIDHTHEAQRVWHGQKNVNHWLDESLCETASLFALRALGHTWKTSPPYPNWKNYAPALTGYAADHIEQGKKELPAGTPFGAWFQAELPSLQENATQRHKNQVVAGELLPLFEAEPAGWEALAALKAGPYEGERRLPNHLRLWQAQAPADLRPFVEKLARVFLAALP